MLNASGAVCLDGSPGAFYVGRPRKPSTKWILWGEGKAWCLSEADCVSRAKATDGSCLFPLSISHSLPFPFSFLFSFSFSFYLSRSLSFIYLSFSHSPSSTLVHSRRLSLSHSLVLSQSQSLVVAT